MAEVTCNGKKLKALSKREYEVMLTKLGEKSLSNPKSQWLWNTKRELEAIIGNWDDSVKRSEAISRLAVVWERCLKQLELWKRIVEPFSEEQE